LHLLFTDDSSLKNVKFGLVGQFVDQLLVHSALIGSQAPFAISAWRFLIASISFESAFNNACADSNSLVIFEIELEYSTESLVSVWTDSDSPESSENQNKFINKNKKRILF